MKDSAERAATAFRRDGYVHLTEVITGEQLAELRRWVAELGELRNGDGGVMQHYEVADGRPQIARTERFVDLHAGLRGLVAEGPLVDVGGGLLGEPLVLYKEKVNYKLPGGAGFAAHQDAPAYAFVDHHLTCMVAVDDATLDNGCLEVVAGRQDALLADDGDGCIDPTLADSLDWRPVPMRAGDVLWFGSRVPHRSGPNHTTTTRRAIFCTYNVAAEGDHRERYYEDKLRYFAATGAPSTRLSTVGGFHGIEPTAEQLDEAGLS